MIQSFISLGWTTVVWYVCGYSLCFGRQRGVIIGNSTWRSCAASTCWRHRPTTASRSIVHVAYQMMFAIITPALITEPSPTASRSKPISSSSPYGCCLVYFPFVLHDLGQRLARRSGECSTTPAASWCTTLAGSRRARLSASTSDAGEFRITVAQHPARRTWNRSAVVRLVRVQRRERVPRRCDDGGGIHQHRPRGSFAGVAWMLVEWMTTRQPSSWVS